MLPHLRLTFFLPSLLILGFAAGGTKTQAASSPKILHYGNAVEPQELDPQNISGIPEARVIRSLMEGLVCRDADMTIVPGVAKSWEVSPDGRVYTFHLRPEAKWSNGSPITARDFVRSFRRLLSPLFAAPTPENFFHVVGAEEFNRGKLTDFERTGFKAIGDHELQISLHQPVSFFLNLLTDTDWMPVPLDVIEKVGPADRQGNRWTRPETFVGNGAFVLKSWRQGQKVVVSRSPTYWDRARTKLDEIHFYPVDNLNVEEQMFRTGQLHITGNVPLTKIAVYQRSSTSGLRIDPYGGIYYYIFNVKRPPFDDARVRRALAYAIDREALIKNVTRANEEPAYNAIPTGLAGYRSEQSFQANLAQARALLAAAGYPEGRGLPTIELLYNTSENHRAIAEAIQQMWRKHLKVEVKLTNQEWKVYLDTVRKTHDFHVARAGWVTSEPHIYVERWQTGHTDNFAQWSNPTYDRLLAQATAAPTPARYAMYQEMEKILNEEMPFIPLYFLKQARLVSPKVIGFRTTMNDSFPWKEVDLAP